MSTTSQITFIHERHSFVSDQSTEKRDAPKRIPRPPNAFMLYRSDFLKRRVVPLEVEKRQQNLSRIAGQCWNMLPETEKAIWFSKAAVVRAEHRAKYPPNAGLSYKDKKRLSARDKRRGATKSGPSFDRSRTRRTRTPYCEGMFAALHDLKPTSSESRARLISPAPNFESPLSTTTSLSPILLPHILPPFISYTYTDKRDSLGFEIPQWGPPHIIQNLGIVGTISSSKTIDVELNPFQAQSKSPTLQRGEEDLVSYAPYRDLEQLPPPQDDSVAKVPLTLPASGIFPPTGYHLAGCRSLSSDYSFTDALTHINRSSFPLYPCHSNELDSSE